MTILVSDGVIRLQGRCLVEDAEPLLLALQENPAATVDVADATRLHLAVVQMLFSARPRLSGTPQDRFVADYLLKQLNADQACG